MTFQLLSYVHRKVQYYLLQQKTELPTPLLGSSVLLRGTYFHLING